jgi:hypothetical protein
VNVQRLLLPLLSKAVFVTVDVPTMKAEPLAGVLVILVTEQLSVAVTLNVTLLAHEPAAALTVMLAGQLMAGNCVSRTVTVKVQVLLLPLLSRATFVTVVVPTGKAAPLAGVLVMLVTAQLSVAVKTNVTLLAHEPRAALTVMLVEQVIEGGCVSVTVTVKEQVLVLPLPSVATKRLVVTPGGKVEPLAEPAVCVSVAPEQLSLKVTV